LKKLNKEIPYIHFKMDTLTSTLALISKNCYMAKIDLKDAYYSLPIKAEDQKYFKFCFNGSFYKFTCLPNGYGPGTRKFTKLLKPPLAVLRNSKVTASSYIDDIITLDKLYDQCVKNVWMCAKIFDKLGFVIHPEKSVFIPSQTIEYLGVIIDSNKMTVTLTADKKTTIFNLCLELLTEKMPCIRKVAKLLSSHAWETTLSKFRKMQNFCFKTEKGKF